MEEEVDKIITENKDKIIGRKKIFNLDKDTRDNSKHSECKKDQKGQENVSFNTTTTKDSIAVF